MQVDLLIETALDITYTRGISSHDELFIILTMTRYFSIGGSGAGAGPAVIYIIIITVN